MPLHRNALNAAVIIAKLTALHYAIDWLQFAADAATHPSMISKVVREEMHLRTSRLRRRRATRWSRRPRTRGRTRRLPVPARNRGCCWRAHNGNCAR